MTVSYNTNRERIIAIKQAKGKLNARHPSGIVNTHQKRLCIAIANPFNV